MGEGPFWRLSDKAKELFSVRNYCTSQGGGIVSLEKIGNDLLHLNFFLIPVDCCPGVNLSHFSPLSPTHGKG